MTINEMWIYLNKGITFGPQTKVEKIIYDAFTYGIFKFKLTKKHKKWFKENFDIDYPEKVSDITPKLQKQLKMAIKLRKKDTIFEEKMKKQRAERGYSDQDAWNIFSWFIEVMTPALKQMRSNLYSYPTSYSNPNSNSQAVQISDEDEPGLIEWKKTLDRMIFLLEEMNEETCSFKNPFKKEVNKAQKEFHKKYGIFGEKLYEIVTTEEERAKDEKTGARRVYFYSDDTNHPEWKELSYEYHKYERVIAEYRDKCREEFFQLFSLHFWDLWD